MVHTLDHPLSVGTGEKFVFVKPIRRIVIHFLDHLRFWRLLQSLNDGSKIILMQMMPHMMAEFMQSGHDWIGDVTRDSDFDVVRG